MFTALGRLAITCPVNGFKTGQRRGFIFQGQPAQAKLQTHSSLHTSWVLCKKVETDKPTEETEPYKCFDLKKLCPDPCCDDDEVEEIAAHVGNRCEKNPCSRVRDPCLGYVKDHIHGRHKVVTPVAANSTKAVTPAKNDKKESTSKAASFLRKAFSCKILSTPNNKSESSDKKPKGKPSKGKKGK